MADDLIGADVSRELGRIGRAEIVVGVASSNSARTIRQVLEAAAGALSTYYPGASGVIVTADGGSRDGTLEAARGAATGPWPAVVVAPPDGSAADRVLAGKGGGLRAILAVAERVDARACALLDADVGGAGGEWLQRLLDPVVREGLDLVAPVYARHRYDGMLTSFLVYPLTRALYGRRVRQPVGGHFGLSGALARRLLAAGAWEGSAGRYSRDLWMTTTALADGMSVGQANLGTGRRGPRDSGAALGSTFAKVVGTAFALMESYRPAWWSVVETEAVPTFGAPSAVGVEPVSVNVDRMIATFRQGLADLVPVWRKALAPETCAALADLAADPPEPVRFPAELWAQVVYDGAVAHHLRLLPRDHLLRALIPLYLGRAAAFVMGTASADAGTADAEIEAQGTAFESTKPYLLDRWDGRRP